MNNFVSAMFCAMFLIIVVAVGVGSYQSVKASNSCRDAGGVVISDRGKFQHCVSKSSLINLKKGV